MELELLQLGDGKHMVWAKRDTEKIRESGKRDGQILQDVKGEAGGGRDEDGLEING